VGEIIYASREEWLAARNDGIGASEAAAVLGISPFRNNADLWREKRGLLVPEDISDRPAVKYGTLAEAPLRELFALDFPQYGVEYTPYKVYTHDKYPQLRATLDGELLEMDDSAPLRLIKRRGVLEIKTTEIRRASQWAEWKDKVPDHYYAQLCHQLLVTGWGFAVLKAQIKYDGGITTRHYTYERAEMETDIVYLLHQELALWDCVRTGREPPRILPAI